MTSAVKTSRHLSEMGLLESQAFTLRNLHMDLLTHGLISLGFSARSAS